MGKHVLLNKSERSFYIGSEVLAPKEKKSFDKATVDRLVALYPGELESLDSALADATETFTTEEVKTEGTDTGAETDKKEKTLEEMTVAELKAVLADKGVELPKEITTKAKIIAFIEALPPKADAETEGTDTGE